MNIELNNYYFSKHFRYRLDKKCIFFSNGTKHFKVVTKFFNLIELINNSSKKKNDYNISALTPQEIKGFINDLSKLGLIFKKGEKRNV